MGEPSDRIFHEETPIEPEAERIARVAIDRLVLDAPGIRSVVLCNTMIYGNALGAPAQSVQIPRWCNKPGHPASRVTSAAA